MTSVRSQLEFELARVVAWPEWLAADLAVAAGVAVGSREAVRQRPPCYSCAQSKSIPTPHTHTHTSQPHTDASTQQTLRS